MTAFFSHACQVAVSIRVPPAGHSTVKVGQFKEVWDEYKEITSNYNIAKQGLKEQRKVWTYILERAMVFHPSAQLILSNFAEREPKK